MLDPFTLFNITLTIKETLSIIFFLMLAVYRCYLKQIFDDY